MPDISSLPPGLPPLANLDEARKGGEVAGLQQTAPGLVPFDGLPPTPGELGGVADGRNQRMLASLPAPEGSGGNGEARGAFQALGRFDAETVSTDIYSVMALVQKTAQEQRNSARELRDANLQQQVSSMKGAADEIRKAAEDRFVGAVVSSVMQIASGAAKIGGGIASGVYAGQAASQTGDKMQFDLSMAKAGRAGGFGDAAGGVLTGVGGMVNAFMEKSAAQHDAKKTDLETQAKVFETNSQQAGDFMQQMMDMIRDVRDKLGSIEQSNVETNRGIARNI